MCSKFLTGLNTKQDDVAQSPGTQVFTRHDLKQNQMILPIVT